MPLRLPDHYPGHCDPTWVDSFFGYLDAFLARYAGTAHQAFDTQQVSSGSGDAVDPSPQYDPAPDGNTYDPSTYNASGSDPSTYGGSGYTSPTDTGTTADTTPDTTPQPDMNAYHAYDQQSWTRGGPRPTPPTPAT